MIIGAVLYAYFRDPKFKNWVNSKLNRRAQQKTKQLDDKEKPKEPPKDDSHPII